MTNRYLVAVIIALASALYMSLFWTSSRALVTRFLPTRLLASVTMATESGIQATEDLSIAFVTAPDEATGEKLATLIVQQKLAACVNVINGLTSVYEWEGKIEKDKEVLLKIKTRTSRVDELSKFVRENHPYDVAEVISVPIQNGNLPYLQWMQNTIPKPK